MCEATISLKIKNGFAAQKVDVFVQDSYKQYYRRWSIVLNVIILISSLCIARGFRDVGTRIRLGLSCADRRVCFRLSSGRWRRRRRRRYIYIEFNGRRNPETDDPRGRRRSSIHPESMSVLRSVRAPVIVFGTFSTDRTPFRRCI